MRGQATSEVLTGNANSSEFQVRERIYTVQVEQVYRVKTNTTISSVVNITTAEFDATCGVRLPINTDLILAGTYRNQTLKTIQYEKKEQHSHITSMKRLGSPSG